MPALIDDALHYEGPILDDDGEFVVQYGRAYNAEAEFDRMVAQYERDGGGRAKPVMSNDPVWVWAMQLFKQAQQGQQQPGQRFFDPTPKQPDASDPGSPTAYARPPVTEGELAVALQYMRDRGSCDFEEALAAVRTGPPKVGLHELGMSVDRQHLVLDEVILPRMRREGISYDRALELCLQGR